MKNIAPTFNAYASISEMSSAKTDLVKRGVKKILKLISLPIRFYRQRQTMAQLYRLNDHELRDIGLFRSDLGIEPGIEDEGDPTKRLARIVREQQLYR